MDFPYFDYIRSYTKIDNVELWINNTFSKKTMYIIKSSLAKIDIHNISDGMKLNLSFSDAFVYPLTDFIGNPVPLTNTN